MNSVLVVLSILNMILATITAYGGDSATAAFQIGIAVWIMQVAKL